MSQPLVGKLILELCAWLEKRICSAIDCEHPGRTCEAAGCDNYICKLHEQYCSRCEQRYCEDCCATHLEACSGPEADAYDEHVEQALSYEAPHAPGSAGAGPQRMNGHVESGQLSVISTDGGRAGGERTDR
jgi:hypothetical protein